MESHNSIILHIGQLILNHHMPQALSSNLQNQRGQRQGRQQQVAREVLILQKRQSAMLKKEKMMEELPRCCLCFAILNNYSIRTGVDEITLKKQKPVCEICRSKSQMRTSKKTLSELHSSQM